MWYTPYSFSPATPQTGQKRQKLKQGLEKKLEKTDQSPRLKNNENGSGINKFKITEISKYHNYKHIFSKRFLAIFGKVTLRTLLMYLPPLLAEIRKINFLL